MREKEIPPPPPIRILKDGKRGKEKIWRTKPKVRKYQKESKRGGQSAEGGGGKKEKRNEKILVILLKRRRTLDIINHGSTTVKLFTGRG